MSKVDFNRIPDEWFLESMKHRHSDVIVTGDEHHPLCWACSLQKKPDGGLLTTAIGDTPKQALTNAITKVKLRDL